jgi:hypothetical protein
MVIINEMVFEVCEDRPCDTMYGRWGNHSIISAMINDDREHELPAQVWLKFE